ncbi:hypothetical protein DFR67_104178 [Williamsia limnetica]|uniref:DoxX-like protein n=2 Tax=Williamsia limnetica TaxID=882452 RepID=A0A318RKM1_WILLI|nr:hypothetical protein DFR67_104178 [Williamsia limnetica]
MRVVAGLSGMTPLIRFGLFILFVVEFVVGLWNQVFPASFYDNFPTVDLTPPYSEHYARDFGGATLGIALLLLIALIKPRAAFVIPAAAAYTVFALPHFLFHLGHTHGATTSEVAALTFANAFVLLVGVGVIVLTVLRDRRSPATEPPS